ncbi:histone deacetylase clr3 [Dendrothele bispora CBS 962.96]|uniref:histone deacetylase n=1 Tax=Dendrothele bispora (strain CBS 962.96) TaxID=1314807 RepID=A0A4S8MXD8_DENBC|nr:histone deacetylase clr3 [Dendrothele bispora CBS 962.96]
MDVDIDPPARPSSAPLPSSNTSDLSVGYVYSSEMTVHFNPSGHNECPERISEIWKALVDAKCNTKMQWLPIRPVNKAEIMLVHSEDHWNKVEAIQFMTDQEIADSADYYEQLSLYVMAGTTRAARLSCGGVIEACLAVIQNRVHVKKAFAIVRPPGHHAEPDEHMGFCFFNNVAVAARVVQQVAGYQKKILILDWDVHHGNGTQKAFNDDPSILYISLHRYENGFYYPCGPFGAMSSCGEGRGLGYSVNIPWPEAGMGDADYIHAFQKIVMPIATEFAPELVIISAGFDAALGDELGGCCVSPAGYAHMTHMLSGLAGGHLVVALEGGYNLQSTAKSALAVTKVLLGEPPEELPPLVASEVATETVWLVAKEQSKYWKSVDPKGCQPREEVQSISFSIPEILKAHRQHYMYTTHNMMQIPLLGEEMEQKFSSQLMCTPDILENDTLVVLAHEFGNLRTELESSITCDLQLERSYLIDFSKDLIGWIKSEGYALLDINLYPKPVPMTTLNKRRKPSRDVGNDVVTYLWDNYIQLSNAKRVILIGHGPGCEPIMELIDRRFSSVANLVRAVVQVVGHSKVPAIPKYSEELRSWYLKCSYVILPADHRILAPQTKPKDLKRHGNIAAIDDESQPIKIIMRALPSIQAFISSQLDKYPVERI